MAPCLCRLMAKTKDKDTGVVRLMTTDELSARTGWGKVRLASVYMRANWSGVKVGDMELFLRACGVTGPKRQKVLMSTIQRALKNGGIRNMWHLRPVKVLWRENQTQALLRMCERVLENEQSGTG